MIQDDMFMDPQIPVSAYANYWDWLWKEYKDITLNEKFNRYIFVNDFPLKKKKKMKKKKREVLSY